MIVGLVSIVSWGTIGLHVFVHWLTSQRDRWSFRTSVIVSFCCSVEEQTARPSASFLAVVPGVVSNPLIIFERLVLV